MRKVRIRAWKYCYFILVLKDQFSLLFLYYWCFFSQQRRMASLCLPETHPTLLPLALHTFPRSKSSSKCRTTPSFLPHPHPTATLAKPRSYGGFLTYTFLIGWFWWGKDKNILEAWFLQGVEGEEGWYFERKRRPTRMDVSEQFSLACTRVPRLTWAVTCAVFRCDNTRRFDFFLVDSNWGARRAIRLTAPIIFSGTQI